MSRRSAFGLVGSTSGFALLAWAAFACSSKSAEPGAPASAGAAASTAGAAGAGVAGNGNGGAVSAGAPSNTSGAGSVAGGAVGTAGAVSGAGASSGGAAGSSNQGGAAASAGMATACGTGTAAASDLVVDLGAALQTMAGFGVSNAYQSTALSDAQADQFFDRTKGIGLSIFRLGITPDGASWGPIADAKKAADRGATVWAAPWTPPANCKSNTSLKNGGHLNKECYGQWADTLAAFPAKAKQSGVTVFGISVQNESDNATPYESCLYDASEMVDFIQVLGPKLKALNPPVKLIAPEAKRWDDLWGTNYGYGTAILANPAAAAQVDILATHQYESQIAVAPPVSVPMPIWQTEMSGVMGYPEEGPSSDIANGLVVAGWIHDAFAIGQASAWHAWWITSLNDDNEGLLLKNGSTTKRLYTLGNFSKFIRPGFQRVTVTGSAPAGVKLTAYKDPSDGTLVIVAINATSAPVTAPFFIAGAPCSLTPWVTSATDNLVQKPALNVSGGHLSLLLGAQSVTTLVGKP